MRLRTGIGSLLALVVLTMLLASCITLEGPGLPQEGEDAQRTLSLVADGPGRIFVDGIGYLCDSTCTVPVEHGSTVSLQAQPTGDQGFAGWEGACSGERSCSVNVDGDLIVRAVFANNFLNIDVEDGGTVHVDPPGVDCKSDCIVKYDRPSEVTVTTKTEVDSETNTEVKTEIEDLENLCKEVSDNGVCVVNVNGRTEVNVETITQAPPDPEQPPADDTPSGEPEGDDQFADESPDEGTPGDDPTPEEEPSGEQADEPEESPEEGTPEEEESDSEAGNDQPSDEEPPADEPADSNPDDDPTSEEEPSGQQPEEGPPGGESSDEGLPGEESPVDEPSSDDTGYDAPPAEEPPADEPPSDNPTPDVDQEDPTV